jgi:hypothetical protein
MNAGTLSNLLYRVAATDQAAGAKTNATGRYQVAVNEPGSFFESFPKMIEAIMNIVLVIGIIAVLLYLIWGGLEWITSGGDKGKTESARNKITAAVVGLIILISAWAIVMFVQQLLGLSILS